MEGFLILGGSVPEKRYLDVSRMDYQLVSSALLNKGMGFTKAERDAFHLHGLLPPKVGTLKEQKARVYQVYLSKTSDFEKYLYLRDLQDSNETLFFSFIIDHLEEVLPIIYTPTVGLGCQKFSHIYRRPRGLFISYPTRHYIDKMLSNERFKDVEIIVVSDGERILGLGDLGAGGMGVPIGKLALYTACAGIHPRRTLPILLDAGTNNPDLIDDPLYIGWRHERIRGKKYDQFIDHFVQSVKKRFPNMLIQWEDFAKDNATAILNRYREEVCTFNDDVQGTAAVVLASFIAAITCSKLPLSEHRILIAGGGSAGCGIAKLITAWAQKNNSPLAKVQDELLMYDRNGPLTKEQSNLLSFQIPFAKPIGYTNDWKVKDRDHISLEETIREFKPTVLIGVTGKANLFTQKAVELMSQYTQRPIIFPLSNPTSCAEADPQNIMDWTQGKAIISTGSPFDDIEKNGHAFRVDQTNNSYIFPGMGLGVVSVQAQKVTDSMFIKAAEVLASMSPAKKDIDANLLPPISKSHTISYKIAFAVAKLAMSEGVAKKMTDEKLRKKIRHKMWKPVYRPYRRKKKA